MTKRKESQTQKSNPIKMKEPKTKPQTTAPDKTREKRVSKINEAFKRVTDMLHSFRWICK